MNPAFMHGVLLTVDFIVDQKIVIQADRNYRERYITGQSVNMPQVPTEEPQLLTDRFPSTLPESEQPQSLR